MISEQFHGTYRKPGGASAGGVRCAGPGAAGAGEWVARGGEVSGQLFPAGEQGAANADVFPPSHGQAIKR